jgi:hypothetical protein
MLALLGAGLLVGILIALFGGGKADAEEAELAPGPVWHPEPASQDDRIARLRRRAAAEVFNPPTAHPAFIDADSDEPAWTRADTSALAPCPVVLARKVRRAGDDWTETASWLGGLPRLAGADWPRDAGGRPLPFAAQIDLAELAHVGPRSPLPGQGSLAFFLGEGAVIAVPPGSHEFTKPPDDLPPAYEEGGAPLPAQPTRLSRYLFPFWPVEPVAVPLPRDIADGDGDPEAVESAVADTVRERFGEPYGLLMDGDDGTLWWYGVFHLADQLREALDGADRPLAAQSPLEDCPLEERAEQEAAALPAMIEAMDGFTAGRDPWEPLTTEERDLVVEILDEIHRRHGRLVRHTLPQSLEPLQALCVRAMISGSEEAFAALPDHIRARIAGGHRVPASIRHQMFTPRGALDGRDDELLLLQLAPDDLMEWRQEGAWRFRISRQDAALGNWDGARLTREGA